MSYDDIVFEATSPQRELARLRDEIRLKVHLAHADARSQWEELEKKWTLLQSRLTTIKVAKDQSMEEVGTALVQLLGELKEGYRRLRDAVARV